MSDQSKSLPMNVLNSRCDYTVFNLQTSLNQVQMMCSLLTYLEKDHEADCPKGFYEILTSIRGSLLEAMETVKAMKDRPLEN